MKCGTLYGIGIGPGDPELLTLKGARLLSRCEHVFVPKGRMQADSVALAIAREHIPESASIHEMVFPMVTDKEELKRHWRSAAEKVAAVLQSGQDACFLTLGDPLLYSTYIYLMQALAGHFPETPVITVPGIMAFNAAAALTNTPVGIGKSPISIIPTADDLAQTERALETGECVVLMKIGKRLPHILNLLERHGALERSVFVSRVGMDNQRIETDLRRLREDPEAGYLSLILVQPKNGASS